MARGTRRVGCFAVVVVLVVVAALGAYVYLRQIEQLSPSVFEDRCVVTTQATTVTLSTEQSHNAAIIVGVALKRKLPSRAATVAIATAYQESGIRNLAHGDRDSVGLFQQRPSQNWGSEAQIMDRHYATNRFYDALIKVKDWDTLSINDAAQAVQRSGHPTAYAKHERNARAIAHVLLGETPAAFSCLDRRTPAGNAGGLRDSLNQTLGVDATIVDPNRLTVRASSSSLGWASAYHAIAMGGTQGAVEAATQGRVWAQGSATVPEWGTRPGEDNNVTIRLR